METFIHTEITTKILRYLQYKFAQKFSVGKNILTLLPRLDVATCLYLIEQLDTATTTKYLYH